jgi:serine/threonine protein kinase
VVCFAVICDSRPPQRFAGAISTRPSHGMQKSGAASSPTDAATSQKPSTKADSQQSWTVHDGQFFARHIQSEWARAPNEQLFLQTSPSPSITTHPDPAPVPEVRACPPTAAAAPRGLLSLGGSTGSIATSQMTAPGDDLLRSATQRWITPASRDGIQPRSWSDHDGQAFSRALHSGMDAKMVSKMLTERRVHRSTRELARISSIERLAGRAATLLEEHGYKEAQRPNLDASERPVSEAGIVLPPSLAGLHGSLPIGEFHKFECIGIGMFASVHTARRVTDGKAAALKLWHRPICTDTSVSGRRFQLDGEDVSCFVGEVALLSRLSCHDHDHIVKYIGHGYIPVAEGQTGFVAMELIKGTDLRCVLRSRVQHATAAKWSQLTYDNARDWVRQIAEALSHLHQLSILHRDVKDSNIMIQPIEGPGDQPQSRAVLIDLGQAIELGAPGASTTTTHQVADLVGVLGFMAPEVYRKRPYGYPADVFALGRVLHRILSAISPPSPKKCSRRRLTATFLHATMAYAPAWVYEKIYCRLPLSRRWPEDLSALAVRCCAAEPVGRPTAADAAMELSPCK